MGAVDPTVPKMDIPHVAAPVDEDLLARLLAAEAAVQAARWREALDLALPVLESAHASPPVLLRSGEAAFVAALAEGETDEVERVVRSMVSVSIPGAIRRVRVLADSAGMDPVLHRKIIALLDEAEGVDESSLADEIRSRYAWASTPRELMRGFLAMPDPEEARAAGGASAGIAEPGDTSGGPAGVSGEPGATDAVAIDRSMTEAGGTGSRDGEPAHDHEEENVVPISRYRRTPEEDDSGDLYDFREYPQTPLEGAHVVRSIHEGVRGGEDEPSPPEPLPLLEGSVPEDPEELHRFVVSNPGEPAREMLRRFAEHQAMHQDLDRLYDHGLNFLGMDEHEQAITVLIPVASVENENQLGAVEALAQAFFHEGRMAEAHEYLVRVIPEDANDPSYAGLFYWLGMVAEEREEPANALTYYTHALRLDPSLVEAKRRARILLG